MDDTGEALTMRLTVIGGQRCADDYQVIWRGLSIGRIKRASGVPHDRPQWSWTCALQGRPTSARDIARPDWARIRAGLTDQDIATARRYSENSAEALARYDARRRGDDGEK